MTEKRITRTRNTGRVSWPFDFFEDWWTMRQLHKQYPHKELPDELKCQSVDTKSYAKLCRIAIYMINNAGLDKGEIKLLNRHYHVNQWHIYSDSVVWDLKTESHEKLILALWKIANTYPEHIYLTGDGEHYLEDTVLSTRTYSALVKYGYSSAEQISLIESREDLLNIRLLGKRGAKEVIDMLKGIGLKCDHLEKPTDKEIRQMEREKIRKMEEEKERERSNLD